MTRVLAYSFIGLCFLMLGVLVHRYAMARPKPAIGATPSSSEESEESVSPIRGPALATRAGPPSAKAKPQPATSPVEKTEVQAQLASAQGRSEAEVNREVELAFTTDAPANAESAKMTASVVKGFESPLAEGAHLRAVDCRATRCRLDLDFKDDATNRSVMSEIFNLLEGGGLASRGLGFIVTRRDEAPEGAVYSTVYLYKVDTATLAAAE